WGDRIYVTTAISTDKEGKAPEPAGGRRGGRQGRGGRGGRGRRGRRRAPTTVHEFVVLAINRKNGKIIWQKPVKKTVPHEALHGTATQASNSPLTDGEHIYAFFGSRGLHCLDMDGEVKWSKDFGTMRTRNQFGEGTSPALYGDTLVINWDHEGDSWIAAFRKSNGKRIWKKKRNEVTTWCTPLIIPVGGRPQVIVTGSGASRAYDLKNGRVIWSCAGMVANCIPTPIHVDGLVYLMSGHRGSSLQAIKVKGAKGDITDSKKHIVWQHGQYTSYTPSGLVYDGRIYFLSRNDGVLSCLDAATGEIRYERQRLGMRSIYSSLVGAAGRIYITSREGLTKVVKLGDEYKELASNQLDDGFDASAAIVDDELYLRGRKHLYCIAKKKRKGL
ncbi:MAG: PQQ-binding-like beta-propeller repeat protein, partial [Planctomycetota bacterium]